MFFQFYFCYENEGYLTDTLTARANDDEIHFFPLLLLLGVFEFDLYALLVSLFNPVGPSPAATNALFFGFSSYESVSLKPVSRFRSFSNVLVLVFFLREDVTTLDMILFSI
jgi:hypothetical protein